MPFRASFFLNCSLISFSIFVITFQLLLFTVYIYVYTPHTCMYVCVYIYSIYSKTEDQTLAGKRNVIISE